MAKRPDPNVYPEGEPEECESAVVERAQRDSHVSPARSDTPEATRVGSGRYEIGAARKRSAAETSPADSEGLETGSSPTAVTSLGATPSPTASPDGLTLVSAERKLSTLFELGRRGLPADESVLVGRHLEALTELLPGRRLVIRLISSDDENLELFIGRGPLDSESSQWIVLSQEAIDRHGLQPKNCLALGARVSARYKPIFQGSGSGFDVPLSADDRLVGVLNVEYLPGVDPPEDDVLLATHLIDQLGARLLRTRPTMADSQSAHSLGVSPAHLLEQANALMVVIDSSRRVRAVNQIGLKVLGLQSEDVLGQDFLRVLPESERGALLPVLSRALSGETITNLEVRLPGAGRTTVRVSLSTTVIWGADKEVDSIIAIGRDLTEVRALEDQVIQSEKLATLGELAAGVVHELNNPLTSICVYGDYLLRKGARGGFESADIKRLERIVESAERIRQFTLDLVAYARPTTEDLEFVSIAEILEQSVVFCNHVLQDANATLSVRSQGVEALVRAVRGQLHQVFINLITNACHALPEGGGQVDIEAEQRDGMIAVCVRDSGCGITEEHMSQVFDPFFSTKGDGGGTGLGLSIVRKIVQQHGGTISVQGSAGGGTLFEVSFPAHGRL